ncbi:MAG: hypothetical protein KJ072_09295 [Verrucomicrobia bacterium]|nr:hypothetical protein [Verrucomicrobiota bacterium]
MSRRFLLLLSLGLNAALGLTFWHWWTTPQPAIPLTLPARAMRLPSPSPSPEPKDSQSTVASTTNLHWNDLASTDFFVYRDNLRAIGCPEKTVRDILESELDQWLFERCQPILDALQPRFWQLAAQRGEEGFEEIHSQLQLLQNERDAMLAAVVGEQEPDPALESRRRRESHARRYHWLPPELQAQLLELEEQYRLAQRRLQSEFDHPDDGEWTPEENQRWSQLRTEHDAAHRALLGDFAEESDLRASGSGWAGRLAGFEPTEDEWRAVTKAQAELNVVINRGGRDYEALMLQRYGLIPGSPDSPNPKPQPDVADAQARFEASVQAAFGPERYAEYQRAGDSSYQQTRRVTERLGLDDNLAVHAWEIQRATQAAAEQLRANTELDAARRQAALDRITAESLATLRSALGDRGFETYQEYAGSWLRDLSLRE